MKMLVIGAAVSGSAAARLGRRLGYEVLIYDDDPAATAGLARESFAVVGGGWEPKLLHTIDCVVVSPGVRPVAAPVRDAANSKIPVISEIELAFRHLQAPIVAVTGTNGKTTVASLIADMAVDSGLKSLAAGNIGLPLADAVGEPWDVVVAEVSSFQLHFIDSFRAHVAVLLNIAPDHLDWHGDMAAYTVAKANVFRNQRGDDLLIYDLDDPGAASQAANAPGRVLPVSGTRRPAGGNGPEKGALRVGGLTVHTAVGGDSAYLVDLAAAGSAALEIGCDPQVVVTTLAAFQPGPHRRTVVGEWAGVAWVDDSKATNPHAAAAAAAAYPSVVLIAGGRNKGLDLAPLATAATVRHLIVIGEAAAELAAARSDARVATSLEEAVAVAADLARPGDTVLLAPGCASFDMFDSYAARGEAFSAAVGAHVGKEAG